MNELIEQIILEVINSLDKPCVIKSQVLFETVNEIWINKGYPTIFTPNLVGRIMNNLGYLPHRTSKHRLWIIK